MADQSQQGPLTLEELQAIWLGAVDSSFSDPFIAAGNGNGLEIYSQAFAQWQRVSQAVDRSFESMFVLPWSGQTNPSASGAKQATVELTFTRTGYMEHPLVLGAGLIWIDENAKDMSQDAQTSGPIFVDTGRRYLLTETVVFFPGEQGPFTANAIAEKPGYGYNNPQPGSISLVEEPGSGRFNNLASVSLTLAPVPPAVAIPTQQVILTCNPEPDMFTPDQIGQYVLFTAGMNEASTARITTFFTPGVDQGSAVALEQCVVVNLTSIPSPAFEVGETVWIQNSSSAYIGSGIVLAARTGETDGIYKIALTLLSGVTGGTYASYSVTGQTSGASGLVNIVLSSGAFTTEVPTGSPETGGASWRVLDWVLDWELVTTNIASPTGGVIGMLDTLGAEKAIFRLPNEPDEQYAIRITTIADVVTPNAILRSLVRSFGANNYCYREIGTPLLPGFFYDKPNNDNAIGEQPDFYDWGSQVFSGTYTSGSFQFQEPVQYLRGLDVLSIGFWGSYLPGNLSPIASAGPNFTLVLTQGRFEFPQTVITPQAGDVIVGKRSGAIFTPSSSGVNSWADTFRWHVYLDYIEFRGFFLVGVPQFGAGEFGFAYDVGGINAYDLIGTTWNNFYDGFPAGDSSIYLAAYNDLLRVHAGGVSIDLYLGTSPCS